MVNMVNMVNIAFWSWGVGFCRERKIPGPQQGEFQQGLQPTTISTHMRIYLSIEPLANQ